MHIIRWEINMNRTTWVLLLSAVASALPAHAALLEGNTVRMSHDFNGSLFIGPQDAVVGPGVEGTFFQDYYTVDVSDSSIQVAFTGFATFDPSAFNGIHVFDVNGTIPSIGSASIGAASFGNLDSSRVTFDTNNVFIDLRGINSQGGEFIRVDLLAAPVPEPTSFTTMLVGLVGVGALAAVRRRERRVRLS